MIMKWFWARRTMQNGWVIDYIHSSLTSDFQMADNKGLATKIVNLLFAKKIYFPKFPLKNICMRNCCKQKLYKKRFKGA